MTAAPAANPTTRISAIALLWVLAGLAGCGFGGLNFLQDKRLTITSPTDRERVDLPVTVEWKVTDFRVTGEDGSRRTDSGFFGLYVDRAPQPPGETQEFLVRDDQTCRRTPGCPDEAFLAQRDIHTTTKTRFTIEFLRDLDPESSRRDFHEVTIVFLNGVGERIGESAFTIQFEVARD
ncbi:MAG: hypothetical protein ACRDI1_07265 [Actinomycetota bacterium]